MSQDWQSFYILVGTSAATLVGLMFVAMSVGSRAIAAKDLPSLRVYVSPTVVLFLYVLVTSAVVLLPTLPPDLLGIVLVVAGLGSCVRMLVGLPVMRRSHLDIHDWGWYFLVPVLSYLLFTGTGIGLVRRVDQAFSGLAAATILLLVAGIRNAWDLVIFRMLPRDEPSKREGGIGFRGESPRHGGIAATPELTTASERWADPVARPPKTTRGEAASRESLALSSAEQGEVARVLADTGLTSDEFTWALQPSRYDMIGPPVSALVHTRTGCFFRFEFTKNAPGDNRVSVFVPGKGAREVTRAAGSWTDQLEQVREWLTRLGP